MNLFRTTTLSLLTGLCLIGFTACKSQFEAAGLKKKDATSDVAGKTDTGETNTGTGEGDSLQVLGPGETGGEETGENQPGAQELDSGDETLDLDESERAIERAVSEFFVKVADRAPDLTDVFYQPQIFVHGEDAYMQAVVTDIQSGTNYCYELVDVPLETSEPRTLLPVAGDFCADPQDSELGTELKLEVACLEGDWNLCERFAFLLFQERLEPVEVINHIVFTGELSPIDFKIFGIHPLSTENPNAKEKFIDYVVEQEQQSEVTEQTENVVTEPSVGGLEGSAEQSGDASAGEEAQEETQEATAPAAGCAEGVSQDSASQLSPNQNCTAQGVGGGR